MIRILITGAAGFVGKMLVSELAGRDSLTVNGVERRISAILAVDINVSALSLIETEHRRVHAVAGPLSAPETLERIKDDAPELIIHLAAVVSSAAEANFDLGMAVNLQSTLDLLAACHRPEKPPVVIFSSSVAVFSCVNNETISDTWPPAPRSSYGTQKLIGELLMRDASRKGFINGRSLRFPTISVRPGKPNLAASSFASGIIREPLAGLPSTLPVDTNLRLHLASPKAALSALLHAIALPQSQLNGETTITLPGISVTVAEMIETLARVAGAEVAARIKHAPDPKIEAIVASWPGEIVTQRATALGFEADAGFEDLILHHMNAVN